MEERTRRRPRIADVAREAGVSKTAVSFAFNRPSRLAPETAVRIRSVAESLGYRPHPVARMLTQRSTLTIGLLTPQTLSVIFSNPFFGAFSEGVARAAEHEGYALQFISPLHGSLTRAVDRAMVDGVVAIGVSANHPEVEQLRAAGLALVMVDSSALPDLPTVEVDDEGGAHMAAQHLIGLGHRDLLIVGIESTPGTPPEPDGVGGRRMRGYRRALDESGVGAPRGRGRRRAVHDRRRDGGPAGRLARTGCGPPGSSSCRTPWRSASCGRRASSGWTSPARSPSSGSTTSTSASTPTPR